MDIASMFPFYRLSSSISSQTVFVQLAMDQQHGVSGELLESS